MMVFLMLLALMGFPASRTTAREGSAGPKPASKVSARQLAQYARLPLQFEVNQGQTDAQARFLARGQGYTLFLTPEEAVLALKRTAGGSEAQGAAGRGSAVLRVKLERREEGSRIVGEEELPGRSNYFVGKNPEGWHTQVRTYAKVRYREVYRGIDLVYYGRQGQVEHDFVVGPGRDAGRIRLRLEGAQGMKVDEKGDLVLRVDGGEVRLERPEAYQGQGGKRRRIEARYAMFGKEEVGFEVARYDHRIPLIIDPVLTYASYVGGTGGDVAYGVGVDSSGNALITGITNSTDFPTSGPEQSSNATNGDAFILKLNSTGTALIYSTYLGGKGADTATAIAVDASGDAFVTGTTTSTDFPTTTGVFQATYGGNGDVFVAQLNSTGNKLVYSSYLGGSGADFGQAIAVDGKGNAYVTGSTQSGDFPTVTPLQATTGGGSDSFVSKVNFSGTQLVYSTYLGGTGADVGQGIKVDSAGNAYVAGYTFSANFPTQNPYQGSNAGAPDAFISELNPAGSALVFSTYLGGSTDDRAFAIALDSSGNIYVAGVTQSTDFPTTSSAFQTTKQGPSDAFVTKLKSGGSNLTYSTFLGGTGADQANGIAVNSSGNAFVTGFTQSSDFPTASPVQSILGISGGSACGSTVCADGFVTQLNPSGGGLTYSTYLGGSGADFGQGIALDSTGNPYVTGSTASTNFPVIAGSYQSSLAGVAGNAFVAKIASANNPGIAIAPAKLNFGNQALSVRSPAQTVTVINAGSAPLQITAITAPTADFAETNDCIGTVSAGGGSCTINITYTPSALGAVTDTFSITDNAAGSPHTLTVTGTGVAAATAVTVSPTSLAFGNQNVGTVSAPQTVTITNTGTATLNITQISTGGDFVQTNTCSAKLNVLNVGESCAVSIAFQPTASGARGGALSIADNASGSPQSVTLSGTGLALFSVSSSSPKTTVVIGSASATFTVSAAAPGNFTGNITLSCTAPGVTCTFNPTTIFAGQTSALTVSGLTAATANPFNFTINGTSGSQNATAPLAILFADYTLSVSPALNTITAGQPAGYTVVVTPLNGFNQQIQLACTNLPPGATCGFSQAAPTPNGSPVNVTMTVNTVRVAMFLNPPRGPFRTPPLLALCLVSLAAAAALIRARRRHPVRATSGVRPLPMSWRFVAVGLVLVVLSGSNACRSISSSGTTTGNYTITVTGTLGSNTAVLRSTTFNLSVT